MTQDGDRRDNAVLGALVDLAREQAVSIDDPRWEQRARGALSRDEEADLRQLAETNANAAFLYEACQPVDERTKEKLVTEIAAGVQAVVGGARPASPRRAPRAGTLGALALALIPVFLLIGSLTRHSPTRTDLTVNPVPGPLRSPSSSNPPAITDPRGSVFVAAPAAFDLRWAPSPAPARMIPSGDWRPAQPPASPPPVVRRSSVAGSASNPVNSLNGSTRDAGRPPTDEVDLP